MQDLISDLILQGLTEKEAKTYISLLKIGQASAYTIAKESGLKRATTYVVITDLMQKGLVLKVPKARKQMFIAKSPQELKLIISERAKAADRAISKLEKLTQTENGHRTLYFEGVNGLKEALYYKINELKGTTTKGFWAKDSGIAPEIISLFIAWNNDLLKQQSNLEGITPDHPSIQKYQKLYPDNYEGIIKIPEKDYSPDVSIEVNEKFVRIVDGHEVKAIIIENPRLAQAIHQIYNMVKIKYQ